jgi:hypothetical protein
MQQTVYEEEGRWWGLSSPKAIVVDGADVVVLLGKKRREFVRVKRADVVDVVPVADRDGEFTAYFPHFRLADGTTAPVCREGNNSAKRVQAKCDAIKAALGL